MQVVVGRFKAGSVGAGVEVLHKTLNWLGYPVADTETRAQRVGPSTVEALLRFQSDRALVESGIVDAATSSALSREIGEIGKLDVFEIRGHAIRTTGAPWVHARVEAFDIDLRAVQPLGVAHTDESGAYAIRYGRERYRAFELGGPDLVVRIARDGSPQSREHVVDPAQALAHVGPIFNAPAHSVVDLYENGNVFAGRSEWDRIQDAMRAILGSVDPASLTETEIDFAARETNIDRAELTCFVRAWRLSELATTHHRSVPAPAAFAFAIARPAVTDHELAAGSRTAMIATARTAMPHLIPSHDDAWIERAVDELRALALDLWKAETGPHGAGFIARVATGDRSLADRFVEQLLSSTGDMPALWAEMSRDAELGPHVAALQRVTRLCVLCRFHGPLVEALEQRFRTSNAGDLDGFLPEIPDDDWRSLVAQGGHPEDVDDRTYVAEIRDVIESAYPSRFVAARLDRLPGIRLGERVGALLRSGAHDLHGAPIEAADVEPEIAAQLARLQRLHRAIGSVDDLAVVMRGEADDPEVGSAGDIARLGRSEVRRRFGEDSVQRADRVYDRALAAHRNAIAIWGKIRPEIDQPVGPHIRPPLGDRPPKGVPPLTSLAIDFCACEKCRSVLGPAAYLADLLATVERIHAPTNRPKNYLYYRLLSGNEERRLRRADLGKILLDCPNATTPLPYIDLVNELLEWHAAGKHDPFEYQTTRTPDELLVCPEHTLADVYDVTLLEAVYPWSLPFSLPHLTARTFLGHFQLERRTMMLSLDGPIFTTSPLERETEQLGLTARAVDLVTSSTVPPWGVWGLAPTNNIVVDPFDDTNHPPHNLPPQTWIEVLRYGMHLRRQSGFEQEQLLPILESRYVARVATTPVLDWPVTECDFDRARVKLTEAQAVAIHAFGRTCRQLGWTPQALDLVLDVTAKHIDARVIEVIGGITRLARRTSRPVVEVLAWIGPISTWPEVDKGTSLYERTFLSPVANPDHQAELVLANDRSELAAPQSPFPPALLPVVGAALGLTVQDLGQIVGAQSAVGTRFVDDRLDRTTLSTLFRIASLARASNLSIPRFLRLLTLLEKSPIPAETDPTKPLKALDLLDAIARIEALLDTVDLLRASRATFEEVVACSSGEDFGARPIAASQSVITTRLAELYTELSRISREVGWSSVGPLPAAFDDTALRTWLVLVVDPDDADATLQLIRRTSPPGSWATVVTRVFEALEPDPLLRTAFVADAQTQLATAGGAEPDPDKRFEYVARRVLRGISLQRQRRAITKRIAEMFGISDAASTSLLARPLPSATPPQQVFAAFELTSSAELGLDFDETSFGIWYAAYRRIARQTLLVARWGLADDELATLLALGSSPDWYDLDDVPIALDRIGAPRRFTRWASTARAVRLRDGVVAPPRPLFAAIALAASSAPLAEIATALAAWSGSTAQALEDLATDLGLASELDRPEALERLFAATAILRTLGVSLASARAFAAPGITLADANQTRDAARASQSISAWVAVARPLQDALRTAQRDALVAYLCAHWHVTPRDLFDFFLIDVEMSDCQLTSRIQQAICSVQLFIQRVSMHLELATNGKPLELHDDEREEWRSWVSTYRTWVQARSVFLYPESTLDPALRPDKSEPFVALEKKIDQADVSGELARDLVLEYLEELDQVAFLDTRAVLAENGVTHVLARTRAAPHRYYYRELRKSRWTPWEAVGLDITDEHVVFAVMDSRLFVFWPELTQKTGDLESTSRQIPGKDQTAAPATYYEIRLAWSERKNAKWLTKRLSRATISTPLPSGETLPTPAEYSLHPMLGVAAKAIVGSDYTGEDDDLWILVRGQRQRVVQTVIPPRFPWEAPQYKNDVVTDVLLGWFAIAGCNGAIRVHDVTISAHGAGVVGPLPVQVSNTIENDDWVQTGELQLQRSNVATQVLAHTGPTHVAHAMSYSAANDQFFRPPMVVADERRAYMVVANASHPAVLQWVNPNLSDPSLVIANRPVATLWGSILAQKARPYFFTAFYHPYACALIERLHEEPDPRRAVRALLAPASQELHAPPDQPFLGYGPVSTAIERPYPQERIEFALDAAYSSYNWELFLHIPILVADRLRANQRFDEALEWLQLVFDPTSTEAAADARLAWQFKPFRERTDRAIQELLSLLDYSGTNLDLVLARKLMEKELDEWRHAALDPHAVALHRPGAWMRAIMLRYVDTLIAWGDALFRRETIEGINEATLMYLAASDVMGPRPREHAPRAVIAPMNYDQLALAPLDKFSNALVHVENWVPPMKAQPPPEVPLPGGMSFYFCIPRNDRLDHYWDTLEDRLYKVRHCLDIEGRYRQLALFDGLLDRIEKARNIGDALDGQGIIPTYRFQTLVQKALELAGDVQKLGGALLSALEKKDAEVLSLLRTSHERALLAAVRDVKNRQVDEATAALEALRQSRQAAQTKFDYYSSRPFTNEEEASHVSLMQRALPIQDAAGAMDSLAGFLHLIPDFDVGISGFCSSPVSTFKFGGSQLGGAMSAIGAALRAQAGHLNAQAALAQTIAGYRRRADDWGLQRDLAQIEMAQVDQQIAAAEIRLEIARADLANQDLQIRNAKEVSDFLVGKFTSQELYGWMVEQLGVLYLRAYETAYDLAKRAERAYQFERGELETTFLERVYFDKLRKGLLAGERLAIDLRRMEAAFFERNRRDLELTKHVSLVADFPDALLSLLTLGWCEIELPESYFDRDHPGHYFRRIKSLALSLPCVGGAFASVNAKVTVLGSRVRVDPDVTTGYLESFPTDARFRYRWTVVDSFAVSTGQNDAGLFEPNLRDDRYLPCEGAGAIARIRIDLPTAQADIDPRRIADAVLHLRYTARDGGPAIATLAAQELAGGQMFASARHDLPDAWQEFRAPIAGSTTRTLAIDLSTDRFPYWAARSAGLAIVPVITLVLSAPATSTGFGASISLPGATAKTSIAFAPSTTNAFALVANAPTGGPGVWSLEISEADVAALSIDDIAVVAVFTK